MFDRFLNWICDRLVFIFFAFWLLVAGFTIFMVVKDGRSNHLEKEGAEAYLSGVPANGNPYMGYAISSSRWLKGWIDAKKESE